MEIQWNSGTFILPVNLGSYSVVLGDSGQPTLPPITWQLYDSLSLSISFVESPDMMNVYNGNITTDANGIAVVVLPDYFEAFNIDFRYQLTVIGTFAQAIISSEIQYNVFKIKTNKPNVKDSWQVAGIRNLCERKQNSSERRQRT